DRGTGKLWTYQKSGQRPEHEASGEEGVRFRVIAAEQLVSPELKSVIAMDLGEIVGEFVTPQDCKVGQENVRSNIVDKGWNLQSYLRRHVGDHVEVVVVPLCPSLVLCVRS